jgi:hypothetical protein
VKEEEERLIAACGLDCTDCDLRRSPFDDKAAGEVVAWYQSRGWLKKDEGIPELRSRGTLCEGCHGNRATHWSADCKILTCCVDRKKLRYCSECPDFVCTELREWAAKSSRYQAALTRLQVMRADRGP